MPPGMGYRLDYIYAAYSNMREYVQAAAAHRSVPWSQQNPGKFEFVSEILALQAERRQMNG